MGEDGSVQGFLEVLKMPYVGCNILSSSLAMDKITTKRVLESAGIAQVPYVAIVEGDDLASKIAEVEEKLRYPVFTKPSNMGLVLVFLSLKIKRNSIKLSNSPLNMIAVSW